MKAMQKRVGESANGFSFFLRMSLFCEGKQCTQLKSSITLLFLQKGKPMRCRRKS